MSEDARVDEEKATQRRAQVLGMAYANTNTSDKALYKDLISNEEHKTFHTIPLYSDEHNIKFGVTNNTSQSTMEKLRDRFLDQRVEFALISDSGFNEYIKLYNPAKKVEYQDVKFS